MVWKRCRSSGLRGPKKPASATKRFAFNMPGRQVVAFDARSSRRERLLVVSARYTGRWP